LPGLGADLPLFLAYTQGGSTGPDRFIQRQISLLALYLLLLVPGGAGAECRPIQVLDKSVADGAVNDDFEGDTVDSEPYQRQVVREAERLMPPLLCRAARRVAFIGLGTREFGGEAGRTDKLRPDLLLLAAGHEVDLASEDLLDPQRRNDPARPEDKARVAQLNTVAAILHEAAHAADFLLQRYGSDEYSLAQKALLDAAYWDDSVAPLAEEIVKRNRLHKGLRAEWFRIQSAFGAYGRAKDYHGQGMDLVMTDDDILHAGWMSAYGGHKVADDIAEMTAWTLVGESMRYAIVDAVYGTEPEGPVEDILCAKLQALPGPGIGIEYAAAYTKLGLLQTTGFISAEAYERCIGDVRVRGQGSGFFRYTNDQAGSRYTGQVLRKIGKRVDAQGEEETSSPYVFEMTATGTINVSGDGEVPAKVILRLAVANADADIEDASFPRGLYAVGVDAPDNQFLIVRTDNDKVVVEVTHGLVLVPRASESLIEGTLVIQKYFNYAGGLMSAMGGPTVPAEPMLFAFRHIGR